MLHFAVRLPSKYSLTLDQVLAIGFLLVILSSALWHRYWPLLVVGIYVVAPLPNWICQRCANPDDFMDSSSSSAMDFGRFMTGFLVLTGIGTSLVRQPPLLWDILSLDRSALVFKPHCVYYNCLTIVPLMIIN